MYFGNRKVYQSYRKGNINKFKKWIYESNSLNISQTNKLIDKKKKDMFFGGTKS